MATISDVLIGFNAQDNVSPVAQQIQGNIGNMGGGIRSTIGQLGSIFSGLNGLIMSTFGMYGLSTFKNMTYGLATTREEVKGLYQSTVEATDGLKELEKMQGMTLWDRMDNLTNRGYVQLDQLTQALNVFKMSSNANAEELWNMAETLDMIGNRAIQMGKNEFETMALMQGVAKGLNGNFQMLNNTFGVSKEALKEMGWSGSEKDIEGYRKALHKFINGSGELGDMLNSTQGKVVSLQKRFRIAGRNIGNSMLPYINAIMDAFSKLNAESNDAIAKIIILSTGALSGFASILPTISPILQMYDFLNGTISTHIQRRKMEKAMIVETISPFNSLKEELKNIAMISNQFIKIPIVNYLKSMTRLGRMSLVSESTVPPYVVDTMGQLAYQTELVTNKALGFIKVPIANTVHGLNTRLGKLFNSYTKLYVTYGKMLDMEGRSVVMMNVRGKLSERLGFLTQNVAIAEGWLSESAVRSAIAHSGLTTLIEEENIALAFNTDEKALNTAEEGFNEGAKLSSALASGILATQQGAEAFARLGVNEQLAVQNALTLFQMGLISEETLLRVLKITGLIAEDNAMKKLTITQRIWNVVSSVTFWYILLIVGAIVGLILVVEKIGETLGWWDSWSEMLEAITNGLRRLWSAFINNPNVQAFIKDIQGLFGALGGAISWVARQVMEFFGWKDDGSEFDIVRGIIDLFGALGNILGKVVNAVKWFAKTFGPIFVAIAQVVAIPIRIILWLLKSIICIIVGCSPGIIPAIERLRDIFMKVFPYIAMALGGPIGIIIGLFTGMFKGIDITDKIRSLGNKFFSVARHIGQMLWNGLNSIIGGIPQKVWNTFLTMINNLTKIPQMVFNKGKEFGESIYNGMDSAVSGLTGGLVHLPGANQQQNNKAKTNAKTIGNVNKNYNNTTRGQRNNTINIGKGAIQLDARNLTTKESKQIMINALEGLTTYETVHTKKASGQTAQK